jgi:aspartyl-tRNA(Asn)/glutamyl-tRNA(Gln) amidotransferase subunit C
MKVSEKDVSYVADLANLELTSDERARMLRDLNSILEYIDRLNELDTGKVEPMTQIADQAVTQRDTHQTHSMRDDIRNGLRESLPQEIALKNAPDTDGTFFEVPKVIEK